MSAFFSQATLRLSGLAAFASVLLATAIAPPALGQCAPAELAGQWGGPTYAVAVVGNIAYIGSGPRLLVIDISDPANPTLLGQSPVLGDIVQDVVVSSGYAYVADGEAGLQVINIADPANPVRVGGYDTSG